MNTPLRKVLFVCQGNICLSPIAQAIFETKLNAIGCNCIIAESVGILECMTDRPASPEAVVCMKDIGIDISDHRARALNTIDPNDFDLIICLEKSAHITLRKAVNRQDKVILKTVSNPFGCDIEIYRQCVKKLTILTDQLTGLLEFENVPQ